MHIFDLIALIIFISGLFIFVNTFFLKLPSSLGLMILTLVLSIGLLITNILAPSMEIAQEIRSFDFSDVLNQMVISVILFAGALNMHINELGKQKTPVIILSFASAVISTGVIGTIVYFLLNNLLSIEINWMYSLIFGAVISSTDPISSAAITARFHLPQMLINKVEGESLFNGAFAVVIAFVLYHLELVAELHEITVVDFGKVLAVELLGGVGIGLAMGLLGFWLLKYVDNHDVHIEVLITIALVLVGSFISSYFNIYSKMVSLIMGLIIGNMGRGSDGQDESVGYYVYKFWTLLEQTMAVMLFVLMGLEIIVLEWRLDYFAAGFFVVNIVLFGRWISVFLPVKIMQASNVPFDKNTISVISWGAFRGGLPIALVLAFHDFEGKDLLITLTYVVVVCSMLFQGFTFPILMKERFKFK